MFFLTRFLERENKKLKKLLDENKITELPVQTIITQMLYKNYIKVTSSSEQNRQR